MTRYIEMFSGGIGSWAAARRRAAQVGTENMTLLFNDTLFEDEDTYRFLIEGAANVLGVPVSANLVPDPENIPPVWEPQERALYLRGLAAATMENIPQLVWNAEGRNPWEVFFDVRFLGNSRRDPCSRVLKRQLADNWLAANCDPAETIVDVGIDWTEAHRFDDGAGGGLRPRRKAEGWDYQAPMNDPEYLTKRDMLRILKDEGIRPPRLYEAGFPHGNCGGFCIKAGQAQFALLLRWRPKLYAYNEGNEREIRAFLDKDVSIMTDRTGGDKVPLTMEALRLRIEAGQEVNGAEFGGCGCFLDE